MTERSRRRHLTWYRRLVALTPPPHRNRFGNDQVTLFGDLLDSGEPHSRLWLRAILDLFAVFGQYKEDMVNHSARISLAVVSLAPLLLAAMLLWSMIEDFGGFDDRLAVIALALILQGGYTLVWLSGRLHRWQRWASGLFAVGESTALVAGAVAATATLGTFNDSDPEYAPLTVAVVLAIHGLVGLLALFTSDEVTQTPVQGIRPVIQ